jgi:hypothetical protein
LLHVPKNRIRTKKWTNIPLYQSSLLIEKRVVQLFKNPVVIVGVLQGFFRVARTFKGFSGLK